MMGLVDDCNPDRSHFELSAKIAGADSEVSCDFWNEKC